MFQRILKIQNYVLISFVLCFLTTNLLSATYNVTTNIDSGPGSLRDAINTVNSDGNYTEIIINTSINGSGQTISLGSSLPTLKPASGSLDINWNGAVPADSFYINGNDQHQAFFIESGTVNINVNMDIESCRAKGGGGGGSSSLPSGGGGGGLGAGGAFFINSGATVTLSSLNLTNNAAEGGKGGDGVYRTTGLEIGSNGGVGGSGGGGIRSNGRLFGAK